ncbi:MAG: DUF1501 domain-containing protein [Gemmataceae bacterium]
MANSAVPQPAKGRKGGDHNNHGFRGRLAGGGTKGGRQVVGETDVFGFAAVERGRE